MSDETYQSKNPKYAGHTAGPWRWEMNLSSKNVQVCGGKPKYDLIVMDFIRWGMSEAAPRFNIEKREHLNVMQRADELSVIVPGREHHADWFRNIDHPDAALIADAPYLACEVERLREMLKAAVSVLDFFVNGNDLQQAMHDARNVIAKHKKGGGRNERQADSYSEKTPRPLRRTCTRDSAS